jgi:predicted AAA+ superfamily ATPase
MKSNAEERGSRVQHEGEQFAERRGGRNGRGAPLPRL